VADTWELFDRLADRYDQIIPFFATFGEQLIDLLDPAPGTRLLDIGTGRGAIAAAAQARGCQVTATDPSRAMIEHLDIPGVDARVMDAHHLDLPGHSYDLATGGFMIHVVDDPEHVLTEVRRVLRPGATVAFTTPGHFDDNGRWDDYNAVVRDYRRKTLPGRDRPGKDIDVDQALAATGYTEVREANLQVHIPVATPQAAWDFQMSHGFAGFVEALTPADAADLQARALTELTRMHANGGIIMDRGATVTLATAP